MEDMGFNVSSGTCYVLFTYDIGLSINLNEAERHITAIKQRSRIRHKRRAPQYFDYRPAPLRVTQGVEPLTLGEFRSATSVDLVIYDFGAVSVIYSIPLADPSLRLLNLSQELYENVLLLADSRQRVEDLQKTIEGMVERPKISNYVEDYVIFQVNAAAPADVLVTHKIWPEFFGPKKRSSRNRRSVKPHPIGSLSVRRMWLSSIGMRRSCLGMRWKMCRPYWSLPMWSCLKCARSINNWMTPSIKPITHFRRESGSRFRRAGSFETDLRQVAQLQVDSAILFERVTNTLKLIGDQYLARVYRLASERFHLAAWDAGIIRKLETLDSIYGKMADRAATRRMEVLEWIIIVLFAISIIISLLPGFPKH